MNIVGVIPARYGSTRFPGKPLINILGKPMVWWVYSQLSKNKSLSKVYVATDDDRISKVCSSFGIPFIMTNREHKTHLDRLAEFSQKVDFDFCINVNGDEPLILENDINPLLPPSFIHPNDFYVANAMTLITNPIEVVDFARIKVVVDVYGYAMYLGRSPIPYPKADFNFNYYKFQGIQCFTKSALQFCLVTPRGPVESIEDIDEYRFLENGRKIKFIETNSISLSVDTEKDVGKVESILKSRF